MKINEFEELLANNNAIRIDDEYIIFNDYELYSFVKEKGIKNKTAEELYNCKIGDRTIKEIIETTDEFKLHFDGGRGAGSGKMGGGFNHAPRNGRERESMEKKYPAEFNVNVKYKSYDEVLSLFREKYADAQVEYGITVDEDGYVHRHIKGGSTSVAITGDNGQMVIHNHPSGGAFSDSDLISVASTKAKGIVAVSSNTKNKAVYTFTKTHKFKSKEFIKAVKKAQWPAHYDYDKGADWWLKKNAATFGYKYSRTK